MRDVIHAALSHPIFFARDGDKRARMIMLGIDIGLDEKALAA